MKRLFGKYPVKISSSVVVSDGLHGLRKWRRTPRITPLAQCRKCKPQDQNPMARRSNSRRRFGPLPTSCADARTGGNFVVGCGYRRDPVLLYSSSRMKRFVTA